MSIEFYWAAIALVTILSAARLTRLAVADKFPPAAWVRAKWAYLTADTGWIWLFFCGYCFSFWATAFVVTLGLLAGVYTTPAPEWGTDNAFAAWWIFNATMAGSYLAAWFMAHDGDDGDEGDD